MKNNFSTRLASAFVTLPSTYVYTFRGYSRAMTTCACGHLIKEFFHVTNQNGHVVQLGNECIHTYSELDHIAKAIKAEEEARNAQEEALKDKEIDRLTSILAGMMPVIDAALQNRVFLPEEVFSNRFMPVLEALRTKKGRINRLNKQIAAIAPHLDSIKAMTEEKLQKKAEAQAKIEALKAASQHVGTVGEKIEITAKIVYRQAFQTVWGTKTLTIMKSGDNKITTYTSIPMQIETGQEITFSCSVKKHDFYKGEKITEVIRVKIKSQEEQA